MTRQLPTWNEEMSLAAEGYRRIAGVDEAGMGCLAGPIYAAAIILPLKAKLGIVRDSKTLSALQRERLIDDVKSIAVAWAVGRATWEEVDEINVRRAGALASRRAVEALGIAPDFVITDAFPITGLMMRQRAFVKADLHVKTVAAASIIAKVERDREMMMLETKYPGYGFARHKGYGTKAHLDALSRFGPCAIHRMTYALVRAATAAPRHTPHEFTLTLS